MLLPVNIKCQSQRTQLDGFNQSVFRPSNKMSKLFVSTENLSRRLFLSYSALVVELQHSGEVADLK
jgi:hypothetical protein